MEKKRSIGFDADDTLWENEVFFHKAQVKFKKLHPHIKDPDGEIFQIEKKNIKLYGYGIKGFILSLIEASAKHSDSQTNIENINKIVNIGKEMLTHRLTLLPGVEDTLKYLSDQFKLIMITKGDLFDQQRKIQESGLSKYFSSTEIVSEKDAKAYSNILAKHNILPKDFIMENYRSIPLYVSSATPQVELIEILKSKKIIELFRGVYGSPKSTSSSKFILLEMTS